MSKLLYISPLVYQEAERLGWNMAGYRLSRPIPTGARLVPDFVSFVDAVRKTAT